MSGVISSTSISTSNSDDEDDDAPTVMRQRKRYKLALDPDYDPSQVCKRTRIKWATNNASHGSTSLATDAQARLSTSTSLSSSPSTADGKHNISNNIYSNTYNLIQHSFQNYNKILLSESISQCAGCPGGKSPLLVEFPCELFTPFISYVYICLYIFIMRICYST